MKKYFSFVLVLSLVFALGFSTFFERTVYAEPTDGGILNGPTAEIFCRSITHNGDTTSVVIGFTEPVYYATVPAENTVITYTKDSVAGPFPNLDLQSGARTNALLFKYTSVPGDGIPSAAYPAPLAGQNTSVSTVINFSFVQGQNQMYLLDRNGTKYYKDGIDWSKLNDPNLSVCHILYYGGSDNFSGVKDPYGNSPGIVQEGGGFTPIRPPTCSDSIQNQDETGIDTGGVCGNPDDGVTPTTFGTCGDGIKNSNETGVDAGGRCSPGALGQIGPGSSETPFGHWASPTRPVKISVANNLSPVYAQFVPRALRDWGLSSVLEFTENGTDAIQVSITNANYGPTTWVGITNIAMNGPHIVSAPIRINDYHMYKPYYNNDTQRQYVVTHELGHAWGLDHQDTNFSNPNVGSVMDYTDDILGTLKSQINNLHPNQNDMNALLHEYAHIP